MDARPAKYLRAGIRRCNPGLEKVLYRYLSVLNAVARPLPLQTVVDSPALFIGCDEPNRWLYVDLRGTYDGTLAQAAGEQMLASLRQWPCQKILSDGTNILAVQMQRTQWGARWLEEMQAAGLRTSLGCCPAACRPATPPQSGCTPSATRWWALSTTLPRPDCGCNSSASTRYSAVKG